MVRTVTVTVREKNSAPTALAWGRAHGGVCIPRAVMFCEFGLAATLQNQSSSPPFPKWEWCGSFGSPVKLALILLCLAQSKLITH